MTLSSLPTEAWGAIAAAAGLATFIVKKLAFPRKTKPEYISRAEFHQQFDSMRDRIAAGYLAIAEKLDQHQNQGIGRLEKFESRLDQLDTAVARLDERTSVR